MFENAKTLKPTVKVTPKKEREQVDLPGLEQLAFLDTIIKLATEEKTRLTRDLTPQALDVFIAQMEAHPETVPDTITGVDHLATATISLRRRPNSSVLSPEERTQLEAAEIPYGSEVVAPELFAINPEYATDDKLLRKVQKALKEVVPDDFIVRQEKVVKHIVTEDTLKSLAQKPSSALLTLCTALQFKPSLPSWRPTDLVHTLKKLTSAALKH